MVGHMHIIMILLWNLRRGFLQNLSYISSKTIRDLNQMKILNYHQTRI